MATDTSVGLAHWLKLDIRFKKYLGTIRHWDNLEVAVEDGAVWVKGFTEKQVESVALKSIPFIHLYYCSNDLLFPVRSLLPQRQQPSLQWTVIAKALPVASPDINFNFFGIHDQYQPRLQPTGAEQQAVFLLATVEGAAGYMETAADTRLSCLKWLLVNNEQVLIAGIPLLPLQGKAYWQLDRFVLPVGYTLEFPILAASIAAKTDATGTQLIWWTDADDYTLLAPEMMQSLSVSSWRQTINTATGQHPLFNQLNP